MPCWFGFWIAVLGVCDLILCFRCLLVCFVDVGLSVDMRYDFWGFAVCVCWIVVYLVGCGFGEFGVLVLIVVVW